MNNATNIERTGRCHVCGRALKNPKYAEIGIGPVCLKKQGGTTVSKTFAGQRLRCNYTIVGIEADRMTIRDDNIGGMSVTNDAEAVVRDLFERGTLGTRRLFYYDSEGQLDELAHDGAKFTGFKVGPR